MSLLDRPREKTPDRGHPRPSSGFAQTVKAASPRAVSQRFGVVILLISALTLLVLGKTHEEKVSDIRIAVIDAIAPVMSALAEPVKALNHIVDATDRVVNAYTINLHLEEQNAQLMRWQMIARQLEQENTMYRALLNVSKTPTQNFVTAQVIGDSGGPFVRTMLVNAGREQGVDEGAAAVTGTGFAGRIADVGARASRLLLLTDLNSRVPVVMEKSRDRAVLAGDNGSLPSLVYLPRNAKVSIGDRVVTSGHGGKLPPGLPVGVVDAIGTGDIRVRPFVDLDRLEYVTVIQYNMPTVTAAGPARTAP